MQKLIFGNKLFLIYPRSIGLIHTDLGKWRLPNFRDFNQTQFHNLKWKWNHDCLHSECRYELLGGLCDRAAPSSSLPSTYKRQKSTYRAISVPSVAKIARHRSGYPEMVTVGRRFPPVGRAAQDAFPSIASCLSAKQDTVVNAGNSKFHKSNAQKAGRNFAYIKRGGLFVWRGRKFRR